VAPLPPADVVYFLSEFPATSETFVAGEVVRLRGRGVRLLPLVLTNSGGVDRHLTAVLESSGITPYYLMDRAPARLLAWAARGLLRHPLRALLVVWTSYRAPIAPGATKTARWVKALAGASIVERVGAHRVHGHWTIPGDVALLVSRITRVTLSHSAHAHDIWDDGPLYAKAGARWSLGARIARTDFTATCTAVGAEYLRERTAPSDTHKVQLVYHGVDLTVFDGRTMPGTAGPPIIASVGRLVGYKGFDRLLAACGELHAGGHQFRCVIAGNGSQRAALEEQARSLGLAERVEFLGAVSQGRVRELLRTADIFALCGRHEAGQFGLPNVLLEAMAMRTATVCTRLPSVAELIEHGANGLIADGDPQIADALKALLDDPTLRRRLADAGRARIEERFDADATIGVLERLLQPDGGQNGLC